MKVVRRCIKCKLDKFVQYYIHEWQKDYEYILPFPICDECASKRTDLVLYCKWIRVLGAMDTAQRNNAVLS